MPYPSPCYVLLQGGKFLTIIGAVGPPTVFPVPPDADAYWDGETYRDEVDSSFLGRASTGIVKVSDSTFMAVDYPGLNAATATASGGDFVMEILENTVALPFPDQAATMMMESDSLTHTAPRFLEKQTSRYVWKDVSSNIIGGCLVSEYIGESAAIPQYVGSVPPIYLAPSP